MPLLFQDLQNLVLDLLFYTYCYYIAFFFIRQVKYAGR
jgi:hypothetical protein